MKNIVITILVLIMPLSGTILSRSTIEEWEGSLENAGWTRSTGGDGDVLKGAEDGNPNSYQTQAHGEWSLDVYDPNNTSYANAYKTFSNSNSEYMTELYIWIWSDHTAPIDSFPLCILWNIPALGLPARTDIALVIDTLNNPPNGGLFTIHVEDADSIHHNEAIIDSTDRWYKIQIYRYVSGSDTVVTFYLDGDSIDTYVPMNKDKVSNKISLGTTQADSLSDGEVFYDDVIISTPPAGNHPRLLFDSNDLTALRNRRTGGNTYLGITYANIWDSLKTYSKYFITNLPDSIMWKKIYKPVGGERDSLLGTFYFPYHQFPFQSRNNNDNVEFWLGPQRRVASELLALAFVSLVDDTAATTRSHAESLLVALSHWQMWNDPYFLGESRQYIQLGVGHFMYSIALSYDWLYDSLSNYERLSIQNTLINLGINQTYLEAINGVWGQYSDRWPNAVAVMIGGMGISCRALDAVDLTNELDMARTRIDDLLGDQDVCDSTGGFAEGVSYGGYATDYLVTFTAADSSLIGYTSGNKFLGKYPDWRIWCMLPGAENYYSYKYYQPTYWDLTFCDYDRLGARWTTGIALIADSTDNSEARWYLKRRKDIRFTERYSKCDRWDLWLPFGIFLWTDNSMDTTKPAPDTLLKVFDGIGWAITRTGWNDSDFLLGLKSGNWFAQHNHSEQGSFIFGSKGRWLIADMGYVRKQEHKEALYHNVLYEANSETLYSCTHTLNAHFETDSSYSYIQSIGDAPSAKMSPWKRNILFFNKLGSFAVMDYAEENQGQEIDNLFWQIHSWIEPETSEGGKEIIISYSNGPNIMGYIAYPGSISTSYCLVDSVDYDEKNGTDTTYYFQQIRVDLPTDNLDTFRVVVGFAPYNNPDSVQITPINGINLRGTKLKNESGLAAGLFGMKDSTEGGKYEVSVTDSLLNVACNLIPDTNYTVVTRRDTLPETDTTLQANDVGVLSFRLGSTGDWHILITLARTTGSIKINNDSTYCNMRFVELNLEMTNPLDSNSVDSMRIWQDYTVNDTLYTDSTGWIPFDSTYFWYLRQGEGTNKVNAQFMGNGWNESIEYCDSIVFDRTLPTGSFVIDDDSTFANNSNVTLKNSLAAADTAGAKMRFGHKYLKNIVKNSAFDSSGNWEYDNAIYLDTLKLFKIPLQEIGNYFYQAIAPESLADFVNDTLLLWIDLVSDGFVGDARVAFQYIYGADTAVRGTHPYGDSITIPEGTNAQVSHYNLYSYFKYYPDPPFGEEFIEARVGVFADSASRNSGRLFIDNVRLDAVSPVDDYTRFEDYDTLKNWTLNSGNGVRKVYGQFSDGAGNETAVSFDSIIVDTTKPARKISYPQNGQTISDTITITGWAHDSLDDPPHFKQYELQHQLQMSANWYGNDPDSISYTPAYPIGVGQGQKPVALGDWNTYQVNYGWYNLKLTVADSASNSRDTTISVCVNNGGEGEGGFSGFSNYVYGLAAGNEVYIGEFNTGKIYQYNTNYELIDTFKLIDSVGTGFPLTMAIDDSGKLWVANSNSHLVSKFSSQGSLLLQFAGGFSMPSGFAFDNSGNIWVSDRLHHKIKKFNQDGDSLFAFGREGSEPGDIDKPIGIAFFDSKIFVADSKNKRVSVFDTLGDFIEVIADSAGLQMPFGLVIDSSGCIFVSDFRGNQVIEFDPYGNQLFKIDSILDSPTGLALSSDANILYVSDTRNKRVLAFQVRGEPPDSGGGPQGYGDSYFDRLMFDVYPSLSAKQMNIRLQGFAGRKISLNVYDVTGRLIKTFYDNQMIKANQSIAWDCKDDINRKLANGVYFVRLVTEGFQEVKKVILLK